MSLKEEGKSNDSLVGATETSVELAEWGGLQLKSLNILSRLNRKGWP